MVETTFMILGILLLVMGIIEFGFLFYAHVRVSNAAREGVRAGSLWLLDREVDGKYYEPTLCGTVRETARSEFGAIEEEDITITLKEGVVACPDGSAAPQAPEAGEPVTVTATYNYELPVVSALPIIRDIIPSPFPVSRMAVMRFQ